MSTDNTMAVCPQCGATGKAGKFCEYCGTKIPMPIKKTPKAEGKGPFLWSNVCPQGYMPEPDQVEGKPQNGTLEYMVVVKKESRQFIESSMEYDSDESLVDIALNRAVKHQKITTRYKDKNTYAIINREGKIVVPPSSEDITLFADNYDYIKGLHKLANIRTGIILDDLWDIYNAGDYIVYYRNSYEESAVVFNRKARTAIALDKEIPVFYEYKEMDKGNRLIFIKEVSDDRILTCTVQVDGNQGIVSIDEKGEQEVKEEEERVKNEEEEKKRTEKKEMKKEIGCTIILIILVLALAVIILAICL